MSILRFEHISLAIHDRQILQDISFEVQQGESITIMVLLGAVRARY